MHRLGRASAAAGYACPGGMVAWLTRTIAPFRRPHTVPGGLAATLDCVGPAVDVGRKEPRWRRAAVCRCGHDRKAHDHYRRGSDCALCDCAAWKSSRRSWRWRSGGG
jgi:hypothetical protein